MDKKCRSTRERRGGERVGVIMKRIREDVKRPKEGKQRGVKRGDKQHGES